jgi:SAM-dependent methyltransferase
MQGDGGYDDARSIAQAVNEGRHRDVIGGLWDQIGALQFEFLKAAGLEPRHTLLDVGCGSLRGGVHFVRYLDAGHYYGIDINQPLLDAGYEQEITPLGLAGRLPPANLACVADFDVAEFGQRFDFVLAVSVFTHVNWCRIRLCMERLVAATRPGSTFFASYFDLPEDSSASTPLLHGLTLSTYGHRDPFHYRVSDFRQAICGLPWILRGAEDWDHPRGQRMLSFVRA